MKVTTERPVLELFRGLVISLTPVVMDVDLGFEGLVAREVMYFYLDPRDFQNEHLPDCLQIEANVFYSEEANPSSNLTSLKRQVEDVLN